MAKELEKVDVDLCFEVRAGVRLCTTDKYCIDMIINNSPFISTRGNYMLHYSTIYKDAACCVKRVIFCQ